MYRLRLLGLALLGLLLSGWSAWAGEWPQWRGPGRDGVAVDEPALVSSWPEAGPVKVWEYPAPLPASGGIGSVVVAQGKALFAISTAHEEPVATRQLSAGQLRGLGWFPEQLPEALVEVVEPARVSEERAGLAADAIEAWVEQWLQAHLDAEQLAAWQAVARDRLVRGRAALGLDTLAQLGELADKQFESQAELDQWFGDHAIPAEARRAVNDVTVKTRELTRDTLVCLDALTGEELWLFERPGAAREYGTSGTPCVVGGRAFFLGSAGGAYCVSLEDGREVWESEPSGDGHASFLVADGLAVVPSPELTALDAKTGKVVWTQPEVKTSHNSPVLWRSDGKAYLLCNTSTRLACVALATGEVLWWLPGGLFSSATVRGDQMAVFAEEKAHGLSLYQLGVAAPQRLWTVAFTDRGASPVIYDGHVYAVGRGHAVCVNAETGAEVWRQNVNGGEISSPIVADGKLIAVVGVDKLLMMRATPRAAEVLAKSDLGIKTTSSPAIVDGRLYLRLSEAVACYDLTSSALAKAR